jgi:hypothetical protein
MKTFSILTLIVIVGLCAISGVDAAAQYRANDRGRGDRDRVCVYKDINYQGPEQCYAAGDQIDNLGAQRKSISSIRVYGRAAITVFENTGFRGHSTEFNSDVSDLGQRTMAGNTTWSDHIDSLRISQLAGSANGNDRRNPSDLRRDQPRQPRDGVCVYDRANYEGRSECWNQGRDISDLASQGNWNGQISSIRLFGSTVVTVYQNTGYDGQSLTIDRDIPDLSAIRSTGNGNGRGRGNGRNFFNWDRRISSIRFQARVYR